jgi:hypothetical protein
MYVPAAKREYPKGVKGVAVTVFVLNGVAIEVSTIRVNSHCETLVFGGEWEGSEEWSECDKGMREALDTHDKAVGSMMRGCHPFR